MSKSTFAARRSVFSGKTKGRLRRGAAENRSAEAGRAGEYLYDCHRNVEHYERHKIEPRQRGVPYGRTPGGNRSDFRFDRRCGMRRRFCCNPAPRKPLFATHL